MARKRRDYAAEYARRRASGRAAGKTTREARGHKNEPQERRRRRADTYRRFGVSPEKLGKLRAQVRAHIASELQGQGTKRPINTDTIARNVAKMSGPMLNHAAGLTGGQMQGFNWDDTDFDPGDFADDDNPFWYH